MATYGSEPVEKKESRTRALEVVAGFIVTLLIAFTSLLSSNVPWWFFYFSFVLLVALAFLIPSVMLFDLPDRIRQLNLKMKRNTVARKYFQDFKAIVNNLEKFGYPIANTMSTLRSHYQQSIDSHVADYILQSYNTQEVHNAYCDIQKEVNESDEAFRDLSLMTKQLEGILHTYEKNIRTIEEFVHEMRDFKGKEIAKGIEKEYESFREQYNLFLNDITKFCHKVNQEIGENLLPEYAFHPIKAW
jgi:hypothetical protein